MRTPAAGSDASHPSQGTASTLTRAEVSGGGKKPFAQKGTGNARQGSSRTPLRPGGGVAFGPKARRARRLVWRRAANSPLLRTSPG